MTTRPKMGSSTRPEVFYYLPRQVYACRTDGGGIVFLDAGRNRYFGLGGGTSVTRLADLIAELHDREQVQDSQRAGARPDLRTSSNAQQASVAAVERLAQKLIEAGLLGRGPGGDLPTRNDGWVPPPDIPLSMATAEATGTPDLIDVIRFGYACARARWSLWRWSLEKIASGIREARRKNDDLDLARVAQLVHRFQSSRSWAFSGKNRCLFNALALIYFLQRYGCFPNFVIGVKTAPFAAHSWVQQDGVIFDGDATSVGHFVPIFVA